MTTSLPTTVRLRPALALVDQVAFALGAWLAHVVRFDPFDRAAKWAELFGHQGFVVFSLVALWAVAAAAELYEPLVLHARREVAVRVSVVSLTLGSMLALATYVVPVWSIGRGLLVLTCGSWAVFALLVRLALGAWLERRPRPRALVVGEEHAAAQLCDALGGHPLSPWEPVLELATAGREMTAENLAGRAAVVVVAGWDSGAGSAARRLANLHFSGVPVVVGAEVWGLLEGRLPLSELSPGFFLHQPGFAGLHKVLFNRLTRVLDVTLGAALLLLGLPVIALAALVVLVLDGRPVVFRQVRVGQYGRPFEVLKLRTMRRDAESDGPAFATPGDPRITPVGNVLRRLRLDELPQLVNVLRGDMSLVGPRPERPEFVADLARTIPFYGFRLAVPPGLTGWAQVSMPYARTEDEHRRRLEYDLFFIRERSLSLYLLTLLRTASAALVGVRT